MAKDRSLVRASDIGAWAFCQRAWWLANVQGAEHEDPTVLIRGTAAHEMHGATVRRAQTMQRMGLLLVGIGGPLLALTVVLWLLFG